MLFNIVPSSVPLYTSYPCISSFQQNCDKATYDKAPFRTLICRMYLDFLTVNLPEAMPADSSARRFSSESFSTLCTPSSRDPPPGPLPLLELEQITTQRPAHTQTKQQIKQHIHNMYTFCIYISYTIWFWKNYGLKLFPSECNLEGLVWKMKAMKIGSHWFLFREKERERELMIMWKVQVLTKCN